MFFMENEPMYNLAQADIIVDLESQTLTLPKLNKFYLVSTGLNGIGETENSGKTPRGWHKVEQKIGADAPSNAVFKARQMTGEIYSRAYGAANPERDWILTRILWLSGLEDGFNRGEGCDTFNRYIYIHGTPETEPMGIPRSHGCIRMHTTPIEELFDLVKEGDLVYLSEHKIEI